MRRRETSGIVADKKSVGEGKSVNISSHAGGGGVWDCHGFEVERELWWW